MEENQKQPKLFITTEEILNGTLQYLGTRPYADVAHLIDALRQSKLFTPPVQEEEGHPPIPKEYEESELNVVKDEE